MKRYLLDAYNFLYSLDEIPPGSLEAKREAIIRLLRDRQPQGRNALTLVFDSREGTGQRISTPDFEIVFTAGETADDWISKAVRKSAHPASLTVVTNDQGLRRQVRGTGAKWISCDDFFEGFRHSVENPKPEKATDASDDLSKITESLKKEWL